MMNKPKQKEVEKWDVNERIVVLCAVRYAMGRFSYAPGAVIDHILANKNKVTKSLLDNIRKDYDELLGSDFGSPYRSDWKDLISTLARYLK